MDRTAAEWKMSLARPAAGGESCKAGFFLDYIKKYVEIHLSAAIMKKVFKFRGSVKFDKGYDIRQCMAADFFLFPAPACR